MWSLSVENVFLSVIEALFLSLSLSHTLTHIQPPPKVLDQQGQFVLFLQCIEYICGWDKDEDETKVQLLFPGIYTLMC